ncbi:sensor histidine kinase [Paenibacillus aurantius]|uniref:histidine kinase n=1 Tax=Paenibacillus aurantius TaxID=2918900 RepID=A0AA96LIH7_9BACL|nr:sensor histidine kinase [Paenibacillus aurantius]WNQ12740.1 sensor histidine kinase [Paenibacillus aurantius]
MLGTGYQRLRSYFLNMRIRGKLLLTYLLLILVPVLTIAWITYQRTSGMIESRVVESTRKSFEQANTFLSYKLNNIKDVSSYLYLNPTLTEILGTKGEDTSLREQIDNYQKLIEIIRSVQTSRDIYSIRLFVNSDALYARENITILGMAGITGTDWYKQMLANQQSIYCRPTYDYNYLDARGVQKIISCIRPLSADPATGQPAGILSVDVLEDSLGTIIQQTNITNSGEVYLLDSQGYVISAKDKSKIGTILKEYTEADKELSAEEEVGSGHNPDGSILIRKQVEGTNWQLAAVIPQEEIVGGSRLLARDLLAVLGIFVVIAVLTAIGVSSGITRRIRLLVHHMSRIETEKWDQALPVESRDEIGWLQQHFNRMRENIKQLIRETYQADAAKKNAELKALQAQINPHFLYNTLELIHWMAMKHRAFDISELVGMLAKFFRLSLSGGKDVIPLRDEIEHVRIYLDIQNKRFSGNLDVRFEIEPGLEELAAVKLLLQPLAENAVLHGIREKEEGERGAICIRGCRVGDTIVLEVEDDGVGMDPMQAERLFEESRSGEGGYGIRNVVEKIRLYYGEEYGLSYVTAPGQGTKAVIRLPVVPYPPPSMLPGEEG